MDELFLLIEKLIAFSAPSVDDLQKLLKVTLEKIDAGPRRHYEAHPAEGLAQRVDFRMPPPEADLQAPFLVLYLRNSLVTQGDVIDRYGAIELSDVSVHHPDFIGCRVQVNGHQLGFNMDSKTKTLLTISFDYDR